jgi:hypothetical protein
MIYIIMISMPNSMNGYSATRYKAQEETYKRLPIYLTSQPGTLNLHVGSFLFLITARIEQRRQ